MSVQYTLAQQNELKFYSVEVDYFSGSVIEHNPDIAHLITSHPTGFILSLNRKSYGYNEAEERYNYPDWGITFAYQDMHNRYLGEHYGLYGHFNFYFLNRNVRVGVAQGISYNTNPYDPETNLINIKMNISKEREQPNKAMLVDAWNKQFDKLKKQKPTNLPIYYSAGITLNDIKLSIRITSKPIYKPAI